MLLDGKVLKPDARKGLIRVVVDDNELVHFLWAERTAVGLPAAEPDLDIVIFPNETEFVKLDRPGARIFLVRFPAEPDRNLLFWAQEPNAEHDADLVHTVHSALNSEAAGMDLEEEEAPPAPARAPDAPVAGPTAAAPSSDSRGIDAASLASVLGTIMGGAKRSAAATEISLKNVLRADRVAPLLEDPRLVQRLAPFLPPEHRSPRAMAEVLNSPQFKHQLELLSHALQSGQLDTSQFGLGGQAFGVAEFLRAIQRQADEEGAASAPATAEGDGKERSGEPSNEGGSAESRRGGR